MKLTKIGMIFYFIGVCIVSMGALMMILNVKHAAIPGIVGSAFVTFGTFTWLTTAFRIGASIQNKIEKENEDE